MANTSDFFAHESAWIDEGASIGAATKIWHFSHGPSMVFTNVVNPRSHVSRKDEYRKTLVRTGASIGANATIVCGTTLGQYCFIGAGSVVTRDVPDYALIVGNPGRLRGFVCYCGEKLSLEVSVQARETTQCAACNKRYEQVGHTVTEIE
jgi:UDP-2-acetamido-3-amino-2,3-dideoxy-glucuronate N-acetyltransferase